MRKPSSLITRLAVGSAGAALAFTGTAFALSSHHAAAPRSAAAHQHRVTAEAGVRHRRVAAVRTGLVKPASTSSVTNRSCVYLSTRDCVYTSRYNLGLIRTHGISAFVPIRCVGMTECVVDYKLTVDKTFRYDSIRAVEASRGGHKGAGHHKRRRHHRHHSKAAAGHGAHKGKHHGDKHHGGVGHVTVTVASGAFTVFGSHRTVEQITLNAAGQKLLAKAHHLRARLTVTTASGETTGGSYTAVLVFRNRG